MEMSYMMQLWPLNGPVAIVWSSLSLFLLKEFYADSQDKPARRGVADHELTEYNICFCMTA